VNPTSPEACVRSALRIQMAKGPGKRALLAAAPAKHGRCALLPLHLRWRVRHRLLLHGQLRGCSWRESVVRARFCHGKPTVTREASVQIRILFFCEPHSVGWKWEAALRPALAVVLRVLETVQPDPGAAVCPRPLWEELPKNETTARMILPHELLIHLLKRNGAHLEVITFLKGRSFYYFEASVVVVVRAAGRGRGRGRQPMAPTPKSNSEAQPTCARRPGR
jgi:hypothetical protein